MALDSSAATRWALPAPLGRSAALARPLFSSSTPRCKPPARATTPLQRGGGLGGDTPLQENKGRANGSSPAGFPRRGPQRRSVTAPHQRGPRRDSSTRRGHGAGAHGIRVPARPGQPHRRTKAKPQACSGGGEQQRDTLGLSEIVLISPVQRYLRLQTPHPARYSCNHRQRPREDGCRTAPAAASRAGTDGRERSLGGARRQQNAVSE